MISRITIDDRSTATYMKATLSDLDKHMVRFDSNTTQFNDFNNKAGSTEALGETSNDIMVNLLKGYKAIIDS